MPIKGLTNRGLSFPEIGSIRKGAEKLKNAPGRDLDYFRVVFDEQEAEAEQLFRSKYGDKPNQIEIVLPFNDIGAQWEAWYEAYTAGRLVARSDGERFIYLTDTKTGEVKVADGSPFVAHGSIVGTYETANGKTETIKMKPVGRLKVVIPELRRLAYLTVHTTSVHDIVNISSQLEAIHAVTGGRPAGVRLLLRRRPKRISVPMQNGQRGRVTKYMLSIEASRDWVMAKLQVMNQESLPATLPPALLPEKVEHEVIEGELADVYDDDEEGEGEYIEAIANEENPLDTYRELRTEKGARLGDLSQGQLLVLRKWLQKQDAERGLTEHESKLLDGCSSLMNNNDMPV